MPDLAARALGGGRGVGLAPVRQLVQVLCLLAAAPELFLLAMRSHRSRRSPRGRSSSSRAMARRCSPMSTVPRPAWTSSSCVCRRGLEQRVAVESVEQGRFSTAAGATRRPARKRGSSLNSRQKTSSSSAVKVRNELAAVPRRASGGTALRRPARRTRSGRTRRSRPSSARAVESGPCGTRSSRRSSSSCGAPSEPRQHLALDLRDLFAQRQGAVDRAADRRARGTGCRRPCRGCS